MSDFGNLTSEGLEESTDRLGGFAAQETDSYTGKIKAAYGGASAGGAKSLTVIVTMPFGEYRETLYVTNKKGENWFLNKDDKTKKVPLPGFTVADEICLLATGFPLSQQPSEDKMMNIYDSEQKKEIPKSVKMLTELLGKDITLGIVKQTVDQNEKNSSGEYVPNGKTRDENVIEKVFHAETKMTVPEIRAKATEAAFHDKWVERNKGVSKDKTTKGAGANGGKSGKPGTPPKAGETQTERKSLFGN